MDSANIQVYKDGNDLIVVFKNSGKEVEDILSSLISGLAETKSVPALDNPVLEEIKKPETKECEVPDFLKVVPEPAVKADAGIKPEADTEQKAEPISSPVNSEPRKKEFKFFFGVYEGLTPSQALQKDGKKAVRALQKLKKEPYKTIGALAFKDYLKTMEFKDVADMLRDYVDTDTVKTELNGGDLEEYLVAEPVSKVTDLLYRAVGFSA